MVAVLSASGGASHGAFQVGVFQRLMGADGGITIVSVEKATQYFPDWKELIAHLPNTYVDELDEKDYIHLYIGDNIPDSPFDEEDWYMFSMNEEEWNKTKEKKTKKRLKEFTMWISMNGHYWEVWT